MEVRAHVEFQFNLVRIHAEHAGFIVTGRRAMGIGSLNDAVLPHAVNLVVLVSQTQENRVILGTSRLRGLADGHFAA